MLETEKATTKKDIRWEILHITKRFTCGALRGQDTPAVPPQDAGAMIPNESSNLRGNKRDGKPEPIETESAIL